MATGSITVGPEGMTKALNDILFKFDAQNLKSADKVTQEAATNMFGAIIEETPVGDFDPDHEGTLKGDWIVSHGAPSSSRMNRQAPDRTRKSIKSQISNQIVSGKKTLYLTNNSPYINVVEFGGYTKTPKRGTFNKRTGRFEIRSSGGFSKQAPKGMARRNLTKWARFLEIAANKIL